MGDASTASTTVPGTITATAAARGTWRSDDSAAPPVEMRLFVAAAFAT
jgi:hypothetical protein